MILQTPRESFESLYEASVRLPGFEPGSSAWEADVLAKLDYNRLRQSTFSQPLKTIPIETQAVINSTLSTMENNGIAENTVKTTSYKLRQIARECDLNDPEQVKKYIAKAINQRTKQPVSNATKHKFTDAYDNYCKVNGVQWNKPQYKVPETTPIIPTTEQVDAIINNASRKYVTIFSIMKETGVAPKELATATRNDIDTEQGILRVRGVKGHDAGTYKLKPRTAEMLKVYMHEHPDEHPFPNEHAMSQVWTDTRRRTIKKLCNPDLEKIELRNPRNYSGATLYKSLPIRDPIVIMRHLRHKKLDTTMHYIRAIVLDYEEDDQWISLVTKTPEEECKAIEKGYQLVRALNETTAIYRKRK